MVKHHSKRFAFTLIELIFAIVIMGIAVVSIPIMTGAIGKGVDNNLVQEAIFAASAEINQVLSYRWDENSIDESVDTDASGLEKVINPGDCNNTTKLRPGHINQPLHRRCLDNNTTTISTAFGADSGDLDDIDDNKAINQNLFINSASADAYKKSYKFDVNISKTDFGGLVNQNNAKEVTVTIKDNDDNSTITSLKSYTFNIGEIDYYKRLYP